MNDGVDARKTRALLAQEQHDLVELLATLTDAEWDTPSLCADWRVRDVVAHLAATSTPLSAYLALAIRLRSADKLNAHLVDQAATQSPSTLVDRLASSIGQGWAPTMLPSIMLADVLVHQQDIRRPLGRARTVPTDRLVAVLNRPDPFAGPRHRMRGLRFVATDIDWVAGAGPEVRGSGEAIALAVAGRPVALDELSGQGVAPLRARLGD